ncbi:MAG: hypothetical protein ISR72_00460 [Methylobacter sp.]|nr:hypothetical protein [Methylobacter sp.]
MAFSNSVTAKMVDFIRDIGIEVVEIPLQEQTFIPGVYIEKGKLLVDQDKLLYPGDLLHEAAHIAMIPSRLRCYATGNVGQIAEIGNSYEIESIAWSWAAVVALGIDPEILFHNKGYKGGAQGLLFNFQMGIYIGIKGIEDAEMAYADNKAAELGVAPFPIMQKWLRD